MVQFSLYNLKFSFINCHLASGAENVDARLKMASDLLKTISCTNGEDTLGPDATSDFSFLMGDLNFRLNQSYAELMPHINDAPRLVANLDQLVVAQRDGHFPGYIEGGLDFMPTYKLKRGENVYKDDADQCPSYCDRILFKNNTSCRAIILEYGSLADYWGSDHRPVFMKMRMRTMP